MFFVDLWHGLISLCQFSFQRFGELLLLKLRWADKQIVPELAVFIQSISTAKLHCGASVTIWLFRCKFHWQTQD